MNYGITRERALELVKQHIKSANLFNHCLAAEAVMRALAERVGEDPDKWGLAGLLHDLDVETHNDLEVHTRETVRVLSEAGVDQEIIEAIRLHNEQAHPGEQRKTRFQHLLAAGYPMSVYTRSRNKAGSLVESGAAWCDTAARVAECSDIVVTMVGVEQEVNDVYLSADGLFSIDINGKIFIDMGTTAPALTQQLSAHAKQHGAGFIDAPVSGGDVGARNATLSIMAGGEEDVIEKVRPLFEVLGRLQIMGVSGSGQHTRCATRSLSPAP